MPIYMDLHIVPGVNAKDVAEAHSMDVLMEKEHSCKCMTYWIDEVRGYVFCLIDAPDKESVINLHNKAHGLVPNKLIEVEPSLVHAFLGRITDPENTALTDSGLKIIDDTSYRIIMHMQIEDFPFLQEKTSVEQAAELYKQFKSITKREILKNNGRGVASEGNEIIASFIQGENAYLTALSVYDAFGKNPDLKLRISLHAGEPVTHSDKLFGDTVEMLKRMNYFGRDKSIVITSGIKELLTNDSLAGRQGITNNYSPKDETFFGALFNILESRYEDENFDMDECCREIAMSQSQLYRKTTQLLEQSPNNLLKNYRLHRAKELLRTTDKTVSQVSFETGFASASYFTKCFKSLYGMLPLTYQELSHQKRE